MRRNIQLLPGAVYENKGGGFYKCLRTMPDGAVMRNQKSGWQFVAHVITMYEDGTIEWDYSTGGDFREEKRHEMY